jgi:uncharacterized membrane protein YqaE (UPF0057 family)
MRYILCVLLPPLAVFSTGKVLQAIFNFFLTLFFWIPGVIHAFFVVNDWKSQKRLDHLAGAFLVYLPQNCVKFCKFMQLF